MIFVNRLWHSRNPNSRSAVADGRSQGRQLPRRNGAHRPFTRWGADMPTCC